MNKSNQNITFKGNPVKVRGLAVEVGSSLPAFRLVGIDLKELSDADFRGKKLVVSIVPSIDTPVCAMQTRRFNQEATKLGTDAAVLTVSRDLPFAQKRWCGAEGVESVKMGSDYKFQTFGETFGAYIEELGLLARAVIIADPEGIVRYVDYVPEIASEPDYDAALAALKAL